jgi:putative ABC transport system permease protein
MKRPSVKRLFRFPSRSRREFAADAREEVLFHVDMRVEDLQRRGLAEAEARAQAMREFGDLRSSLEDGVRHERQLERRRLVSRLLGDFRQDVRLGVRLIARNPGLSAAAILTLAVAVAGNTAVFSVANALMFKPVPVAIPQELARVRAGQSQMSWPTYQDLRERTNVFSELVAHRRLRVGLSSLDALPVRLEGEQTSLNFFDTLRVSPTLGRTYGPGEPRRDVVVLANHTWRVRFGADPTIRGRILILNGYPFEVVGVMPAGFRGVAPAGFLTDVWLPVEDGLRNTMLLQDRRANRFEVFGRLRPGVTHPQAAAALTTVGRQIQADHAELSNTFADVEVFPVDGIGAFRGMSNFVLPLVLFLALMTAMAGVVLLIACANIAGLLIGRATARRREIAVRLALGAHRGRLVRQLLTESLVLALIGGGLGVLVAVWLLGGVNAVLAQLPIPMAFDLQMDRRVLLYALALSSLAALVFGLAPARRAARFDVVSSLKDISGSIVRQRLRRGLVVSQIAACSALLVWSGLFARSLGRIIDVDPGFDPTAVLLARIEFDDLTHDPAGTAQTVVEIQQRLERAPNLEAVGVSTVVPLSLENEEFDVMIDGSSTGAQRVRVMANRLTPGWFETLRIPLLSGREFTWDDRAGAPDVAVVNETFARRFWNGNAVGQRLRAFQRNVQVVGIVRDSKYWTLGETIEPTIYLPFQQHYFRYVTFHMRTANRPAAIARLTSELRRTAPDLSADFSPMTDVLSVAVFPARVGAAVAGAFGALAMFLAALGVYGLLAFSVAQRTAEIGVRKAVGAQTMDLVRLIVSENVLLAGTGLGVGLALGTLGGNLFRRFITDVSPIDPLTLAGTAMLVIVVALLASASPALRAVRVSPLVVLRDS